MSDIVIFEDKIDDPITEEKLLTIDPRYVFTARDANNLKNAIVDLEKRAPVPVVGSAVWYGTQAQFIVQYNLGLNPLMQYYYQKIWQVHRIAMDYVSYILTRWDNGTTQIIESDCNLSVANLQEEFSCDILVATDGAVEIIGAGELLFYRDGVEIVTDRGLPGRGLYRLIRKGNSSTYYLC